MSHQQEQPHEHDLLHLCLAVLVAVAVVLLGWFLVRTALPGSRPLPPNRR